MWRDVGIEIRYRTKQSAAFSLGMRRCGSRRTVRGRGTLGCIIFVACRLDFRGAPDFECFRGDRRNNKRLSPSGFDVGMLRSCPILKHAVEFVFGPFVSIFSAALNTTTNQISALHCVFFSGRRKERENELNALSETGFPISNSGCATVEKHSTINRFAAGFPPLKPRGIPHL